MTAAAELERRYRLLLALYPRQFRGRSQEETLGVLMTAARPGQRRPGLLDALDIVKGALIVRLRPPRTDAEAQPWAAALAAFALLAPWFLVAIDVLAVLFPYHRAGSLVGGSQFLHQPEFCVAAAGNVILALAALAGLRRTALAVTVAVAIIDVRFGGGLGLFFGPAIPTFSCLLMEAVALAASPGPGAGRRLVSWRHGAVVGALTAALQAHQLEVFAQDVPVVARAGLSWHAYLALAAGCAMLALAMAAHFRLGWPTCLLLAGLCLPFGLTRAAFAVNVYLLPGYPGLVTLIVMDLPPLAIALTAAARAWGTAKKMARHPGQAGFA